MNRILLQIAITMLALGAGAFAQTFTGIITGTISDSSQAAIADARVTLTNDATGETRTAVSGPNGNYQFPQLLPSTYSLKAAHSGFQDYVQTGIRLSTNQAATVNIQLTVGAVSQAVEVSANAQLVDSETANRSMTLTPDMVSQLPLNMRNPLALVHASAGVVAARTGVSQATQDQNQNRFSLNGGRHESTAVLVDGIPMGAGDWGGMIANPAADAVQEIQIVRNTYDTEFGRTGGGVVNITTKGGTQQYHGGVFDFLRNDNLDANSFFNNKFGRPLAEFKRNQFGGTIGGPVWKSKRIFGFFSYEGLRAGSPASRLSTVPTDLQRAGDFSQTRNSNGSLSLIYDPLTTAPDPTRPGKYTRTPFAGNVIPAARFDPVALNVLKLFPNPNQAGNPVTGVQNWYGTGTSITVDSRYDTRIDWARSEKHTLFGRFTIAKQDDNPAVMYSTPAETGYYAKNPRYQVSIGNTFILSPTFIVNALVGGGRWSEINFSPAEGYNASALGLPPSVVSQFDVAAPPTFSFGDYTALGYGRYLNGVRQNMIAQVNVTKQLGVHSLKFGASWENTQLNFTDSNSPSFSFDRYFTSGPDPDAKISTAGNTIASLLLGTGSSGSLPLRVRPASTDAYYGFYIQDTWKVSSRLTVNYGARYEIQKGRTERYNRFAQINLDIANPVGSQVGMPQLKGGLVYMTPDNRAQWDTPYNNIAPRVGVAYKLTDRLVARAGYGIFFDRTTYASPLVGTDGFSVTTPWVTTLDSGRTPNAYLSNPFPQGILPLTGSSGGAATNVGVGLSGFLKSRPTPYIQQYSFDLEYQLGRNTLAEIGYTGTQGRKLLYGYGVQLNQLPDEYLAMGSQLLEQVSNPFYGTITSGSLSAQTVQRGQLLRPFPQFTSVSATLMPGASSSYNALVTRLSQRFAHGLTLELSYQFSKALDNSSESGSPGLVDGARDFNNLSLERSISSHDVPHSFAAAFVVPLPFGHGRALGSNWPKVVNAILGGWETSGIYGFSSGLPSHFTAPNNTNSFGGNQQPNVSNMNEVPAAHRTIDTWFNTGAFSQAAPYTFGNAPRWFTNVRFSSRNNVDMALVKTFRPVERVRIQFRSEFFNALNRTQFGWPDTGLGSNTFGQVTSTAPGASPRNIQLGLRVNF